MTILVKAVAGSHLFGLNTPTSDMDYKGVYLPKARDILLGTVQDSIKNSTNNTNTKNCKDDVDTEFYSVQKFFKMLKEGQTVALELLFTPDQFIIEKHPLWDDIVKERNKYVHKGLNAFIGYAKQQADRYGLRGSRMGALEALLPILEVNRCMRTSDLLNKHPEILNIPHCEKIVGKDKREYLSVCSKKFDMRSWTDDVESTLGKFYSEYGERSRDAKENNGIDWKALSHALRVMHQGKELLDSGHITLPLPSSVANYIMQVKKGELDYLTNVQPTIENWMELLKNAENVSNLPKSIDIDEKVVMIHKGIINGEEYNE